MGECTKGVSERKRMGRESISVNNPKRLFVWLTS